MLDEIRDSVRSLRSRCLQCGGCDRVCPSFRHGGCDPMKVMAGDASTVLSCIGCGKCTEQCPATDPKLVMMTLKAEARGLSPPPEYGVSGYILPGPDPAVYGDLPEVGDGEGIYVMPGCVAKRKVPYIVYASRRALQYIGVPNRELPGSACCTYPAVFRLRPSRENVRDKERIGRSQGGRETVALCGGCRQELLRQGIDFPHIAQYLARHTDRLRGLPGAGLRIALQPGCSGESFADDMRSVAEACGCTVVNSSFGCCGKGVGRAAAPLMEEREGECRGADAVVVGCPNCLPFYDGHPGGVPVLYISELVCLAAGDTLTQRYHRIKLGVTERGTRYSWWSPSATVRRDTPTTRSCRSPCAGWTSMPGISTPCSAGRCSPNRRTSGNPNWITPSPRGSTSPTCTWGPRCPSSPPRSRGPSGEGTSPATTSASSSRGTSATTRGTSPSRRPCSRPS